MHQQATSSRWMTRTLYAPEISSSEFLMRTEEANGGRRENDDEQDRKKKQHHRNSELRRERSRLLLGFGHAHISVFLRQDAEGLPERSAIALRLNETRHDRLDALKSGALSEVLESLPAVLQVGQLRCSQTQLLREFGGL